MGKTQLKSIFFGVFGCCLLACVTGDAVAAPLQAEVAVFAALTVSTDQSARVVISNVTAPDDETNPSPCQMQVKFFGPDGSLADEATTLQLKPGESRSVTVSHPPRLLRASVSMDSNVEISKACELKARVEVFDVQTGTTFVSIAADAPGGHSECASSSAPASINIGQDITSAIGRRRRAARRYSTPH
jgi:hypothetical protein